MPKDIGMGGRVLNEVSFIVSQKGNKGSYSRYLEFYETISVPLRTLLLDHDCQIPRAQLQGLPLLDSSTAQNIGPVVVGI